MNRPDSYEIEISLFEQDGVTPLDLSTATGIIIALYQNKNNIVAKYSLNALTGYVTLSSASKANLATGKITLFYEGVVANDTNVDSKMFAEVVVEFNNANFPSGKQRSTAPDIELEVINRTAQNTQALS